VIANKRVSLITTCMGRADHLDQTLPTWLCQPVDEIIVVDWSSPDYVKKIIDRYQDGRIIHVHVPNQTIYDRSKSRNVGVRVSTGFFLMLCEIDIIVGEQSLSCIQDTQDVLYRSVDKEGSGLAGVCVVTKSMLDKVNGYNERLEGWGREDYDLFERLRKNNYPEKRIIDYLKHVDHSNERRVEFHVIKDYQESQDRNYIISVQQPWTVKDKQKDMYVSIVANGKIWEGNVNDYVPINT
jgi:N-terminal domain of galactosyltransferase